MDDKQSITRSAILSVMLWLDDAGYLFMLSDAELAKLLQCNRTTAYRYRRDLPLLRQAITELTATLQAGVGEILKHDAAETEKRIADMQAELDRLTERKKHLEGLWQRK